MADARAMIDIRALQWALLVEESGSFRKAAQVLCVRPSAIGRRICALVVDFELVYGALVVAEQLGLRPSAVIRAANDGCTPHIGRPPYPRPSSLSFE